MNILRFPLLDEEQLTDQFQQTMRLPMNEAGEMRLRGALQALMGELLRHNPKYDMRVQSMLLACHLRLRALQNHVLASRRENDFAPQRCDLRAWFEDICAAADMLLHPLGRSVVFNAPEETVEAACAPRDIAWLLLELICNCARHSEGEEIRVAMDIKRKRHGMNYRSGQHRPAACFVNVACEGELDLRRLHAAGQRPGTGIAAVQRIAYLHGGSMIWLGSGGRSIASLRIPLRQSAKLPLAETPDFVELLSDQLSPVYTALAPAISVVE